MLYDPNWEEKQTHRKFLLDAIELLETKGWVKGVSETPKGFCIIGAVSHVTNSYNMNGDGWTGSQGEAMAKRIATKLGWVDGVSLPPELVVAHWNDRHERSKPEVIQLLKEVVDAV